MSAGQGGEFYEAAPATLAEVWEWALLFRHHGPGRLMIQIDSGERAK